MIEYNRVFLDTAPLIYYLQRDERFFTKTKELFAFLHRTKTVFVSSDITIAEYCVYPYRSRNLDLIRALESFIRVSQMEIVHTSERVAQIAAKLRAKYVAFKTMDALQIALAMEYSCDVFLTNDKQLKQVSEITVLLVDEL